MDFYFNKLNASGVVRQVQHAETISGRSSGLRDTTTPRGLLNAVFYTKGKSFCLRKNQEQRGLKISQLKRLEDHYVCYENFQRTAMVAFENSMSRARLLHCILYKKQENDDL